MSLKPGDRALVIRAQHNKDALGVIVTVTSFPYTAINTHTKKPTTVVSVAEKWPGFLARWITSCLVRIPPDSEMEQLFREKEHP